MIIVYKSCFRLEEFYLSRSRRWKIFERIRTKETESVSLIMIFDQ